jgi:hypothetical protein
VLILAVSKTASFVFRKRSEGICQNMTDDFRSMGRSAPVFFLYTRVIAKREIGDAVRRYLGPHAAAAGAACSTGYVRHLRRCGHLDGMGIREGKAIVYSVGEILQIALGNHLAHYGFTVRQAFNLVEVHAAKLAALGLPGALHAGGDLVLEFPADDPGVTLLAVNVTALAEQVLGRLAKFKIQNTA